NLAGGIQPPIYPNTFSTIAPNSYPNAYPNNIPYNVSMPTGFNGGAIFAGPARQQWDTLTLPAGSAFSASGPGNYFELYTGGNANAYYIWYNVSGGNTDPAPAGFTGVVVDITSASTAAQVASATETALASGTPAVPGFSLLAYSAITNTGSSAITGNVGLSPAGSITPGAWTVTGTIHNGDSTAAAAMAAAQASFTAKQTLGLAGTTIAAELGGQTLTPGNYQSATSFGLSNTTGHSTLTFNGAGTYILYSPSTLLTGASGSTDFPVMVLENGATAANIFWIVGSSATINQSVASTGAIFQGNVIADASITITEGGTVNGNLTALNGAITISATTSANTTSSTPGSSAIAGASYVLNGSSLTVVLAPTSAQVARPAFSKAPGTYFGTQSVTLSSATAGAAIYYTTNGSQPTPQSTLYTGAISVASSQTIQAIATHSGLANSQITTASYKIT
ncbi:MAG TPA: ice-binding family protein, partial [Rhabdochlamydiaceae bacterium]